MIDNHRLVIGCLLLFPMVLGCLLLLTILVLATIQGVVHGDLRLLAVVTVFVVFGMCLFGFLIMDDSP